MQLDDITILVRNKALTIEGMIPHAELDFEASIFHNNIGTWKLTLPADHVMAPVLRTPGSGIVVAGPDGANLFSGPTSKPELSITPMDPSGTVVFDGITDTVILADALAFPSPALAAGAQTVANDVRTGASETLMHAYVNANIGPGATALRRKTGLVMGTNLGRGTSVTKAPRFQVLGELLAELSIEATYGLGFRVVQRGSNLAFETYQISDKSAEIRLDALNGTLSGQRVAMSPPGITAAIVAGQGEGINRQIAEYHTTEADAAGVEWGRRIERFIDQRQTSDWAELEAAALEPLLKEGLTAVNVQAVPADDTYMSFGTDWYLGDRVTVVVEGQELQTDVTGFVMKADKEGFKVGAIIGDPTGFQTDAGLSGRVSNTESRISAIERTTSTPLEIPYNYRSNVQLAASSTNLIPTSNSWQPVRFIVDRGHSIAIDGQPSIRHDATIGGGGKFHLDRIGRYRISASYAFALGNSVGKRWMRLSSSVKGELLFDSVDPGASHASLNVDGSLVSVAGEYLWLDLLQTSGAALGPASTTEAFIGTISIDYLGPA